MYPTFLQKDHQLSPQIVGLISIIANVGALLGGIFFGTWSEKIGRRKAIVIAALLSIPLIPLWVYSRTVPMLAVGGFLMQFMVQGAWGVIPAHLNELSPPAVRGNLSRVCIPGRESFLVAEFGDPGEAGGGQVRRRFLRQSSQGQCC